MYKVIYDYGCDGWSFSSEEFDSAVEALAFAMDQGYTQHFKIVKIIEFAEVE